jgi:hypothetical protein
MGSIQMISHISENVNDKLMVDSMVNNRPGWHLELYENTLNLVLK